MQTFVNQVAESRPTPGGGAVAALAGALAAALAQMGAGLTVGRRSYQAVHEEMQAILDKASDLRQRLLDSVDEDQIVYGHVMLILQQRNENNEATFAQAMEDALKGAAQVPLRVVRLAAEVAELAERLAHVGNKHAVADVTVAALLAQAAVRASRLNVIANLRDVQDDKLRKRWVNEATRLADATDARVNALVAHVEGVVSQPPVATRKRRGAGERGAEEQRSGGAEG